jgi:hypothetical protein
MTVRQGVAPYDGAAEQLRKSKTHRGFRVKPGMTNISLYPANGINHRKTAISGSISMVSYCITG